MKKYFLDSQCFSQLKQSIHTSECLPRLVVRGSVPQSQKELTHAGPSPPTQDTPESCGWLRFTRKSLNNNKATRYVQERYWCHCQRMTAVPTVPLAPLEKHFSNSTLVGGQATFSPGLKACDVMGSPPQWQWRRSITTVRSVFRDELCASLYPKGSIMLMSYKITFCCCWKVRRGYKDWHLEPRSCTAVSFQGLIRCHQSRFKDLLVAAA